MIPEFDAITFWLAETFNLSTVLLAATVIALSSIKQPARRMPVAWGAMAGLAALAILPALSWWPRIAMPVWQSAALAQNEMQPPTQRGQLAPAATVEPEFAGAEKTAEEEADVARLLLMVDAPANLKDSPIIPIDEIGMTSLSEDGPTSLNDPNHIELIGSETSSVALKPDIAVVQSELSVSSLDWKVVAMGLWFSGALLAEIWIAGGAWSTRRLFRRSQEAPGWIRDELRRIVPPHRREPATRISPFIASALAYGAVRPAILRRDPHPEHDARRGICAALAHEYAHIAHGDLWLLALERLLLPVYFVHPLFWLLRRWIRADQELLADAAAAGRAPVAYAEALLE